MLGGLLFRSRDVHLLAEAYAIGRHLPNATATPGRPPTETRM
jgi:hypothetical protein